MSTRLRTPIISFLLSFPRVRWYAFSSTGFGTGGRAFDSSRPSQMPSLLKIVLFSRGAKQSTEFRKWINAHSGIMTPILPTQGVALKRNCHFRVSSAYEDKLIEQKTKDKHTCRERRELQKVQKQYKQNNKCGWILYNRCVHTFPRWRWAASTPIRSRISVLRSREYPWFLCVRALIIIVKIYLLYFPRLAIVKSIEWTKNGGRMMDDDGDGQDWRLQRYK